MTNPHIARVAAGVPTGGEFASQNRNEAGVNLGPSNRELAFDVANDALTALGVDMPTELSRADFIGFFGDAVIVEFQEPQVGGFQGITVNPDSVIFDRDGAPHRTNGPAVYGPHGTKQYFVDGEEIEAFDGGEAGYDLVHSTDDRSIQTWATGDGRTIELLESGEIAFWKNEKLHRDGGPALIFPNGREDWFQNGRYFTPVVPDYRKYDTVESVGPVQYTTATGSKYDELRSLKDISKLTKQDILKAAKFGVLPEGTNVSVRTDPYSQGVGIHVVVTGFTDKQLYQVNPATGEREKTVMHGRILDQLTRIGQAYQKSAHDNGTDYSYNNFHLDVSLRTS